MHVKGGQKSNSVNQAQAGLMMRGGKVVCELDPLGLIVHRKKCILKVYLIR